MSHVNPSGSRELLALRRQGINDRGTFVATPQKKGDGHANRSMKFQPDKHTKGFEKKVVSPAEIEHAKKVQETNVALNHRDAMVAELANQKPNFKEVIKAAEKLLDQDVPLSELNWSMGTTRVRPTPRSENHEAKAFQAALARSAYDNLSAWLSPKEDKQSKGAFLPMDPPVNDLEVIEVLVRLQTGLASSLFASESVQTTTTTQSGAATTTTADATAAKQPVPQNAPTPRMKIEKLDAAIAKKNDELKKARAIGLEFHLYGTNKVSLEQKKEAHWVMENAPRAIRDLEIAKSKILRAMPQTPRAPLSTLERLNAQIDEQQEKLNAAAAKANQYESGEVKGSMAQAGAAKDAMLSEMDKLKALKALKVEEEEAIKKSAAIVPTITTTTTTTTTLPPTPRNS